MNFNLSCATIVVVFAALVAQADKDKGPSNTHHGSDLCTTAQLRDFLGGELSGQQPFTLTGIVTYATVPQSSTIVLKDSTGLLEFYNIPNHTIRVGDELTVSGHVKVPSKRFFPYSFVRHIQKIGHREIKTSVPKIAFSELNLPTSELRYVKTEATVIDIINDDISPYNDFILLRDGDTILPAFGPHSLDYQTNIDARIEIEGLVQHEISSDRKFIGTCLSIDGPQSIKVLTPPPADPFDCPPLVNPYKTGPQDVVKIEKRTVSGFVAATWNEHHILIKSDDDRYVIVNLSANEKLPSYGDRITAVGYPSTDLLRINLKRAKVRVDSRGNQESDAPKRFDSDSIPLFVKNQGTFFATKYFGWLATVRGIVRTLPIPQKGDYQILLDCGDTKLPVDLGSTPSAADDIQLNSEIEVTGRFLFQTTEWQPMDILPRVTGLMLVIRKPDDIRVVSRPPWLTVRKLLVVVGVLLAALIGLYARSLVRKRYNKMKLKERTQLAVELHDSLSQALTGLACQIAGAQMDDDMDSSRRKLTTADQMLQSCRTELKNCLFDLRNDTMTETSFDKAIRRTLEPLADQAEIHVRFNVNRERFDDFATHSILVMIRELVANAIRHGHAWTVKVAGTVEDGKLLFSVTDDGCGFDPASCPASDQGHFGLDGIRERIKRLNGTFDIQSHPKRRTKAVITIPITRK